MTSREKIDAIAALNEVIGDYVTPFGIPDDADIGMAISKRKEIIESLSVDDNKVGGHSNVSTTADLRREHIDHCNDKAVNNKAPHL